MFSQKSSDFICFSPEVTFLPAPERFKNNLDVLVDTETGEISQIFPRSKRAEILNQLKVLDKTVDTISGGALLPGLTDAHMHPLFYSMLQALEPTSLKGLNQNGVSKAFEQAKVSHLDQSQPLLFLDLDSSAVSGIDATMLDDLFGQRAVCVYDASFHSGIVSGLVVNQILASTSDQTIPGYIRSDGNFAEAYGFEVLAILCQSSQIKLFETIEKSLWKTFSTGTTTIHDLLAFDVGSFRNILEVRKTWRAKYKFDFPITKFYLRHQLFKQIIGLRLESDQDKIFTDEDSAKNFGIKLFADGSFGSRTAHVSKNYSDCPTCGLIFDCDEDIRNAIHFAQDELKSHSIALHAIGDEGIKRILNIIENDCHPNSADLVFRIEHFELPSKEIIGLAKKYEVHVVPQPNFLLDLKYKDRLQDRVDAICPLSDISEAGVPMMFGTDGMPESMLYAIYLSTHARESSQRLSLEQALHYSIETAAQFEGDRKGTIEVGQKADLLLVDESLIDDLKPGEADIPLLWSAVQEKVDLLHSKIRLVFKSGQKVFERTD